MRASAQESHARFHSSFVLTFAEHVNLKTRERCFAEIQKWRQWHRQCPVIQGEKLLPDGIRVKWWRDVQAITPVKWFQICLKEICGRQGHAGTANWTIAADLAESNPQESNQNIPQQPSKTCDDFYDAGCVEKLLAGMRKPHWERLEFLREPGEGSFGTVRLASLDGVDFAVKAAQRNRLTNSVHDSALLEVIILMKLRGLAWKLLGNL